METKVFILVLFAWIASAAAHGVATSHQSVVSGEGWRYGYGIVHGPHGIGHAVGESFPHGYGGFGTYAPAYGYTHKPPLVLPPPILPQPLVVKVPQYNIPYINGYGYGHGYPYGYGHLHGYPSYQGLQGGYGIHGYHGYQGLHGYHGYQTPYVY